MVETIFARVMKTSRDSSLASRSSSRWRKRVSVSVTPWNLSGGGRSDLASSVTSSASSDSSPRRVRTIRPDAPAMSPRSRSSARPNASSPRTSSFAHTCIRPERSVMSRNAILPASRRAVTRPATRARTSVSAPGSRSSCGALAAAIVSTSGYACGNGSRPASRSSDSLRRRAASSSPSALIRLADGDLGDLELAHLAGGQVHVHHVVLLVAEQRLADRRFVREPLRRRRGVGLGRADDHELIGLRPVLGLDVHGHADADDVGVELGRVDDGGGAQLLLEGGDARLEHHLLVLRVVVLGVLGDVAELASLLDALGNLTTLVG